MSEQINIQPTSQDLKYIFELKNSNVEQLGWGPKMRQRFHYSPPNEWYEALINKLVQPKTHWLDVGSGRFLFPGNPQLAQELSSRCQRLVGLDPDPTLHENTFVHEKVPGLINDYSTEQKFDLVTMNMVAEHIADPVAAVNNITRLLVTGGHVVLFTIFKWSPVPIATYLTPFWIHHPIKKVLWRTETKDTFPVAYKMNTKSQLRELFKVNKFDEKYFVYLDDCRTFARYPSTQFCELSFMNILRHMGLHYPEVCILAVYQKI